VCRKVKKYSFLLRTDGFIKSKKVVELLLFQVMRRQKVKKLKKLRYFFLVGRGLTRLHALDRVFILDQSLSLDSMTIY
jgi:hypothetical protein